VSFHEFECLLNQFANVIRILLRIVNLVSEILVFVAHKIQNGQDLTVVGHQSFSHSITRLHQKLDLLQCFHNDFLVLRLEGTLNRNDKLWQDSQNFVFASNDKLVTAAVSQELGRLCRLSETLEEDGQVVVVVEHLDLDLPLNLPGGAIEVNHNWHVIPFVKHLELGRWDNSKQCVCELLTVTVESD